MFVTIGCFFVSFFKERRQIAMKLSHKKKKNLDRATSKHIKKFLKKKVLISLKFIGCALIFIKPGFSYLNISYLLYLLIVIFIIY
jgi:hypothetical protein